MNLCLSGDKLRQLTNGVYIDVSGVVNLVYTGYCYGYATSVIGHYSCHLIGWLDLW